MKQLATMTTQNVQLVSDLLSKSDNLYDSQDHFLLTQEPLCNGLADDGECNSDAFGVFVFFYSEEESSQSNDDGDSDSKN